MEKRPLTIKLITYLFLFSLVFIVISSTLQFVVNYREGVRSIESTFKFFEEGSLESISLSIYFVDYKRLLIQLEGGLKLEHIEYIEVRERIGDNINIIDVGEKSDHDYMEASFDLTYSDKLGNTFMLGEIVLYANVTELLQTVLRSTMGNMALNGLLIIFISITFFIVFQKLFTKHLNAIADYTNNLDCTEVGKDLVLHRKSNNEKDELDQIVFSVNNMRKRIFLGFQKIRNIEKELSLMNEELEKKVELKNNELNEAIDSLKETQRRLVESEKVSALRGLVAGVAHEINSPIGIGVTGLSYLTEMTRDIDAKLQENKMKKSDLVNYLNQVNELSESVYTSLNRASSLVSNLKNVAADQSSEEKRSFNFKTYVEETLVALRIKLKKTHHLIKIDCPEDLVIHSIPGSYGQIIINLVLNSLLHGFENIESGIISIEVTVQERSFTLIYSDNGCGIKKEYQDRIFDPFFTTKKHKGGTGLGLQIINNIVTQTLRGTLKLESEEGAGVRFIMIFPVSEEL